jgi:hypothetical protein
MLVRIYLEEPEQIAALDDMHLDFASLAITDHADVVVTSPELAEIERRGFQTEIIQREEDVLVPSEYHTVDETWAVLDSLHQLYPTITELDTCGFSQRFGLPIPHFVISQNVGTREDEPAALINGMHHAREPIGNEICLFTMKRILEDYPDSAYAQRFVDSMDVHFVPILNPEGWRYVTDSSLTSPWWRKNLRDNANNGGPIDPNYDGVDLNRNYDWRWAVGGSSSPSSWVYRGPYPVSESEIQALVSLSTERKFVVGISYHSYGYIILFPSFYDGQYTPDLTSLFEISQNMGWEIGDYDVGVLNGNNMSSVWLYGALGMYDFLIETAQSFIPPAESIIIETEKNFRGLKYLLNRSFYSGITGHVLDSLTLEPLEATIEVIGLTGDSIVPRTTDSLFGRFYRLLQNRTYEMRFSRPGYTTKTISNIPVVSDSLTYIEVLLAQIPGVESGDMTQHFDVHSGALPNPFRGYCIINVGSIGTNSGHLSVYDVAGRLVRSLARGQDGTYVWDGKDEVGRRVEPGVYFYQVENNGGYVLGKVVMVR